MQAPKSFIFVDDDATNNILCKAVVRKVFPEAETIAFLSPSAALEYIRTDFSLPEKAKPSIIFLDINMPGINGWEFLDELKTFSEEVIKLFKIYMLSSSIDNKDMERAKENELVTDYIPKPLKRDLLSKLFDE